jgi:hypothetical protein
MGNSPSKKNKNNNSSTPKKVNKDSPSVPPAVAAVSTNPPSHNEHIEKAPSHAAHTPHHVDPAPTVQYVLIFSLI